MKRFVCAALVCLTSAIFVLGQTSPWPFPSRSAAAAQTSGSGTPLRVAFWNIRWFPGGRPNAYRAEQTKQINSVHREIRKLDADVIGFEEVRDWNAAALAVQPLAGFHVDVCSEFPPREGQTETQNVAIVSRLDPMSAWFEEWKAGAAVTPPRGFAFAAYEIAPRKILLVYAVHLKSNRGEVVEDIALREESIRQLLAHIKDMQAAYAKLGALTIMIGGDFNTAPDDSRFAKEKTTRTLMDNGFRWIWEGMPLAQRITLPPDARFPAACFDHIFYRGATLRKSEALQTSAESSDHHAIRAEFTLP